MTKNTVALIFFMLIINLVYIPAYSQKEISCPIEYNPNDRHIPLQEDQISKSPTMSKMICSYHKQSTSTTIFEVSWSPSGKIYGGDWCTEKLTISHGIGEFQSSNHYVRILANGILPHEKEYAQNFMYVLYDMLKSNSKSCLSSTDEFVIQLEPPQEEIIENKDLTYQETKLDVKHEPDNDMSTQFPFEIIIVLTIAGIAYMLFRKYKKIDGVNK